MESSIRIIKTDKFVSSLLLSRRGRLCDFFTLSSTCADLSQLRLHKLPGRPQCPKHLSGRLSLVGRHPFDLHVQEVHCTSRSTGACTVAPSSQHTVYLAASSMAPTVRPTDKYHIRCHGNDHTVCPLTYPEEATNIRVYGFCLVYNVDGMQGAYRLALIILGGGLLLQQ